jgi:hypothetical protein
MKVKIKIRHLVALAVVLIVMFSLFYIVKFSRNYVDYFGRRFVFRDSVELANKILTYPNEKVVHELFWDPNITNITIVFKPISSINPYYVAEVFELTYKLSLMYRLNAMNKNFGAEPIDSYENITEEKNILKIILIPPSIANETYISVDGNRIYVYAKNLKDFDLAIIKVILCAMGKLE